MCMPYIQYISPIDSISLKSPNRVFSFCPFSTCSSNQKIHEHVLGFGRIKITLPKFVAMFSQENGDDLSLNMKEEKEKERDFIKIYVKWFYILYFFNLQITSRNQHLF